MIVGQGAFAHERMADGNTHMVDKRFKLVGGAGGDDAAADMDNGVFSGGKGCDDFGSQLIINGRFLNVFAVVGQPGKKLGVNFFGEYIHGDIDEYGARPAGFGEGKGFFKDFGEKVRPINAPGAFDEGSIDFPLGAIGMHIDFLMGMLAVVVAGNVAGDDDHGDGVESGVGDAGGGVCQARAEMAEHDGGFFCYSSIAIGRMGGNLLMPDVDEFDFAAF